MSRHAFGYRFGHKFRSGGVASSTKVPHPYHCAIGGHPYILDWAHYTVNTIGPFRTARDFDPTPGEHSLNTEGSWKRNRDDWRHGAGQVYSDRPPNNVGSVDSDDYRFHASKGVDWTVDRQLSLLHDTDKALTSTASNLRALYVGGWLYVLDGSTLRYTNTPHAATITWTNVTLAAAGLDLTTDGNLIYVALAGGNGIYSLPIGSPTLTQLGTRATSGDGHTTNTSTTVSAADGNFTSADVGATIAGTNIPGGTTITSITNSTTIVISAPATGTATNVVLTITHPAATDVAQLLAYCNGWLMAGIGPTITSVATDGTHVGAYTHPVGGGRWIAAAGAPNAIYAAFVANDISLIYQIGVDKTTGGLTVPILATPLPAGETITGLGYYATRLLVGTSRGVRVGEIDGAGNVALGPLIASGANVRCFADHEALSYFGWGNYDSLSTGLGVLRLADLVAANQPAWSSWLMAGSTDTGIVQGAVTSVCVLDDGQPWFCVAGSGLWRPAARYVQQGTLDQGSFTFGVHEPKSWLWLEIVTMPLHGAVGCVLENDDGTSWPFGLHSLAGSTGLGDTLSAVGQFGEQASLLFTLYRDVATGLQSPVVRRVTFRALPNPITAFKWIAPLILRTTVNTQEGEGGDVTYKVSDELRFLRGLNKSLRPVQWQIGTERDTVQVRSIDLPEGMADGFASERDAVQGTWVVTLVSAGTQ